MIVIPVWSLPLVKALLFLIVVWISLVTLIILRAHKALGILLVNCCHYLPANFGLWSFGNWVILKSILIFFNCVITVLNICIVNAYHRMNHAIVISLIVFYWSHHTILNLRMLVSRSWPRVCHSSSLSFWEHIVQCWI